MLPQVLALDRHTVRRRFEQRFSSARMASDYVALDRSLLERPSISERETPVPLPRPVLERKANGQGLHGADEQETDCNHAAIMFWFAADLASLGYGFRKRQPLSMSHF
jgi:hypothetical protein